MDPGWGGLRPSLQYHLASVLLPDTEILQPDQNGEGIVEFRIAVRRKLPGNAGSCLIRSSTARAGHAGWEQER